MVLILMTACWTLVVGRILGVLIRCPLVFLHFLAISNDSCTHPRLSWFFMSLAVGKLLRSPSFPASWLYSDTLILVVNGCSYPWGFAPCLSLWLQVLICLYVTILLQAIGCRHLIPVPLVVGIIPSAQSRRLPQHRQGSSGF